MNFVFSCADASAEHSGGADIFVKRFKSPDTGRLVGFAFNEVFVYVEGFASVGGFASAEAIMSVENAESSEDKGIRRGEDVVKVEGVV